MLEVWGGLGKGRMVADVGRRCNADILCLEKTKLNKPSQLIIRTLCRERLIEWIYKKLEGASGVIMMGFDKHRYVLVEIYERKFSLTMKIVTCSDGFQQIIIVVYDHNENLGRTFGKKSNISVRDGIYYGLLEVISI